MSYRLPPLNGLRAFEASARHLSFKRAADELHVTAGAVSQQVKSLEAMLGFSLFRRLPRGLLLTTAGEEYLPSISRAFREISEATAQVAPALGGRRLKLGIAPAIKSANYPALKSFRKNDTTDLRVTVVTTDDLEQLRDGRLDAVLRTIVRSHPGLHLDPIDLRTPDGEHAAATLFTLPGLAGCYEHRALVKLLRS